MEKNRVEALANNLNGVNGVAKLKKKPASGEVVLAVQLHQARETILSLRKTITEQEQVIAQLQAANYALEAQKVATDNAQLLEKFGLKTGQRLEQDETGAWVIVEEDKSAS